MSLARVQYDLATGSGTHPSNAYTSSTTAGNTLVAVTSWQAIGATLTMPTGWVQAVRIDQDPKVAIWFYANAPSVAANASIQGTLSGSSASFEFILIEYSGLGPSPMVLTNSYANTGNDANPTVGTSGAVSPGVAAVIVAGFGIDQPDTVSNPTGGFSIVSQGASGTSNALAFLEQITTGSGTFTAGCTQSAGDDLYAVIAAFVPGTVRGPFPWFFDQPHCGGFCDMGL